MVFDCILEILGIRFLRICDFGSKCLCYILYERFFLDLLLIYYSFLRDRYINFFARFLKWKDRKIRIICFFFLMSVKYFKENFKKNNFKLF